MPDPTTTHRLTTAAVPEWAAEVAAMAPRILSQIAVLRDRLAERDAELADVKAECCQLTCRNGDLAAENKRLRAERDRLIEGCIAQAWRSSSDYVVGGNGYEWRYGPHGEFVAEKSHAIAAVRKAAGLSESEPKEPQ